MEIPLPQLHAKSIHIYTTVYSTVMMIVLNLFINITVYNTMMMMMMMIVLNLFLNFSLFEKEEESAGLIKVQVFISNML